MKYFPLFVVLAGCAATSDQAPKKISADQLEKRYKVLWDSVHDAKSNLPVELPPLTVQVGGSNQLGTSIWVLTDDVDYSGEMNRQWRVECRGSSDDSYRDVPLYEAVYDPMYRVAYLDIVRREPQRILDCQLHFNQNSTTFTLPAMRPKQSKYSFLAYSCSEPFSSERRDGKTGILARDLSLWLRMGQRARGEDSNGQLPFSPDLVLGVGDQVYVDPAPKKEQSLAFFKGNRSNEWLIENDSASITKALKTVYRYNFSNPAVANAFSNTSSKMMWDDHEIRDGWGSQYDENRSWIKDDKKEPKAWQRYYKQARHAFIANQLLRRYAPKGVNQETYNDLVAGDEVLHTDFSLHQRTHGLMLDSRSVRNVRHHNQIFDCTAKSRVKKWLASGSDDHGDLFVLTVGTPLFPSKRIEPAWWNLEIKDDLIDGWGSDQNVHSRNELIKVLKEHFKRHMNDRLLVISGDVHFSSLFYLSIGDRVFGHEVVTSGIAHSLPSEAKFINRFNENAHPIEGITVNPAGKISDSASFAEFIVDESDPKNAPTVELVFHANGTKSNNYGVWNPVDKLLSWATNTPKHRLGNTHLLNKLDSTPLWYHKYSYKDPDEFAHRSQCTDQPPESIAAGTIVELALEKPDAITKPTVTTYIQTQAVFQYDNNTDFNNTRAKTWTLKGLTQLPKSCENK